MPRLCYLIPLLFISFSIRSEDRLDTIEVKSDKEIQSFTFSSIETIPASSLEQSGSLLLVDQLARSSSVILNQNGGPGGRTSFFMRGAESRHVGVFLDGLRLNDPSNTDRQFDAAFISSSFLSNIKTVKGAQSVLFGSDSLAGVLLLNSRKGENAFESRAHFTVGSFGTLSASSSSDWGNENSRGTVSVNQFHSDGISRLNYKRYKAKERDGSDITQLTSSSRHQWSNQNSTDVLFSLVRGSNQLDGIVEDYSDDQSRNDQYLFQQRTQRELTANQILSLRNGLNRHQREILSTGEKKNTYSGNYIQHELLYLSEKENRKVSCGVSVDHEDFSQARKDFDVVAFFSQLAYEFHHFNFQAGVRVENHSRYGDFEVGSFGLRHEYNNTTIALQYSEGYKAPSLYQLYGPPIFGYPVGNVQLGPERSRSWELSAGKKNEHWKSEIVLFENDFSNLITYTNRGYLNHDDHTVKGAEFTNSFEGNKAGVEVSFTHQAFIHNRSQILRRPRNVYKIRPHISPSEGNDWYLSINWFSSSYDTEPSGRVIKLNGYEVVDVGYIKTYKAFDGGIKIQNIFDRNYETIYGASVMPRSLFGHIGFVFN